MTIRTSPERSASESRARILAAAAGEFGARGFAGAKVDRIAARARLNKALLYYYFRNKAALYRAVLLDVFRSVAAAVEAADAGRRGTPDDRLRRFIQAVADETVQRPQFPATWLREMAEGGPHVDHTIVAEMRRVLETLGGILHDGRTAGLFAEANPFVVQISIVAPLLIFAATTPVRQRFRDRVPAHVAEAPRELIVRHVQAATLGALRIRSRSES